MTKSEKDKKSILEILNKLAAKRFNDKEKIGLIIGLVVFVLIGDYFFTNWINEFKNKNNIVVSMAPPIKPKLPASLVLNKTKVESVVTVEAIKQKIRDPFLSSKNPKKLKNVTAKKTSAILKVSGILWDEKIPTAIINSKVLNIGDLIENKTVVDIEQNRVVLMEDGQVLVLELRDK